MSSRFWFKVYYRNTEGKLKMLAASRDSIVAAHEALCTSIYYGDVTVKCDGLVCLTLPAYLPSNGKPEVYHLSRQIEDGYVAARNARRARQFARDAQRMARGEV